MIVTPMHGESILQNGAVNMSINGGDSEVHFFDSINNNHRYRKKPSGFTVTTSEQNVLLDNLKVRSLTDVAIMA